jgi:hypothetical protein
MEQSPIETVTEPIHSSSLQFILYLQSFQFLDPLAVFITQFGDPTIFFMFIFPILYICINTRIAFRLLCCILIADLLNACLKWPARGDRPYWMHKDVREFWLTCESGFGMPR